MIRQAALIILLSVIVGGLRQVAPKGISLKSDWPSSTTSAYEAYDMMAEEGDPAFIGLPDVIDHQTAGTGVLLDARASALFAQGRIPGSRSLPYYELDEFQDMALEGLEAEALIIIYCEGIGCELSFFLGRELQDAGYSNVRIFYGGYPEWEGAGLPIEKPEDQAEQMEVKNEE